MKKNNQKLAYSTPELRSIKLDNEISLQLQSATPPDGPGESGVGYLSPEFIQNNPFKTNLG